MNKVMSGSFIIGILVVFLAGCAEITPPNPVNVITHPFGTETGGPGLRIGDTKDRVKDKWGDPNRITPMGLSKLGAPKEEWVYFSGNPSVPVDLTKTKYLYFEGDVLTSFNY